ncbi:transporter [Methyloceanibacter sp.]|uniref:transporter n=1 Tax=Methyloceanibacter sp. TaxID=1965321 RepID=UPI002D48733D|nr:transporter [Methyloceanibacter sp.]HZP07898.1 transporter [Methyloceanibacter sp.]
MHEALTDGVHPGATGETLPGLVFAFRFTSDGAEELPVEKPIDETPDGWLWLHFNLADARACRLIKGGLWLPAVARDLLVSPDEHQQINVSGACLYGVFADLVCDLDGLTEEIGFLHFALSDKLLVTGRRRSLSAVNATRKIVHGGASFSSPAALLQALIEQVVDSIDRYADDAAAKLDRIEEKIVADDVYEGRRVLGRIRRATVRLHRQLVIFRALLHRFELDLAGKLTLDLAPARLGQRIEWLDAEIVSLRDRAHLLQEEVTMKTAEQTNRNLHVLAVVTTLFMPASLIAGIFGMNVGGLPFVQDSNGFWWAMAIVAVASAIVLWLLKRSGILKH